MVDEDGYLEEILLEDGEEIQFDDSQADASLQASIDKVNELQHILLLGIDARPGQTTGRSDTMIILTVDTNNQKIKLMSLMRDIIVAIPGRENNRLNAAYCFGGADLLLQTIEENFGIHIEHYVGVNFSLLADLIDQIGGLTLTVESEYYMDRINAVIKEDNKVLGLAVEDDGLLTQAGEQLMTGKQAQAYARYRYGTSDGDFGRTARQREVITKIFHRLTEMSLVELSALALANVGKVVTNLTLAGHDAAGPGHALAQGRRDRGAAPARGRRLQVPDRARHVRDRAGPHHDHGSHRRVPHRGLSPAMRRQTTAGARASWRWPVWGR